MKLGHEYDDYRMPQWVLHAFQICQGSRPSHTPGRLIIIRPCYILLLLGARRPRNQTPSPPSARAGPTTPIQRRRRHPSLTGRAYRSGQTTWASSSAVFGRLPVRAPALQWRRLWPTLQVTWNSWAKLSTCLCWCQGPARCWRLKNKELCQSESGPVVSRLGRFCVERVRGCVQMVLRAISKMPGVKKGTCVRKGCTFDSSLSLSARPRPNPVAIN